MPKSRLDRMLAPWVFVLTGISTAARAAIIDAINNTCFETLKLQESRIPLASDNS